jgi:hypothetical protein
VCERAIICREEILRDQRTEGDRPKREAMQVKFETAIREMGTAGSVLAGTADGPPYRCDSRSPGGGGRGTSAGFSSNLLVTERLDWVQARGSVGRIEPEPDAAYG